MRATMRHQRLHSGSQQFAFPITLSDNRIVILQENYSWSSVGGRQVCLTSVDISDLTEPERIALQQVALTKLRQLNLRSHVTIPKSKQEGRQHSK